MSFYDPLARHRAIEKLVVRDRKDVQERKYWRFRFDRWYGGIVTADAVGCGLVCKYCWVSDAVMFQPAKIGRFYSPKTVAKTLVKMAEKRALKQLRVSGGEPTIGRRHLLQLLNHLEGRQLLFMLETNGILIGSNLQYAEDLSKHRFLHVRVSLKGCNEDEFAKLTGAKPEGFTLQLEALKNLLQAGVRCHPAVMMSFSAQESVHQLVERLKSISPELAEDLEVEELILYPKVKRKIERHGLKYYTAYTP
ncbi:MAG: radical SAM protein [Candidatus Bathyarchaeota archaeon]|nr:radical SAM protein [Candidatus Bathyarchaeota archaeon]